MGVAHQNQTKGKGRFQGTRHLQQSKGPIVPANSKKGTVKSSGGKKAVTKMKKAKGLRSKGTAKTKLHGTSKTRTSKTGMNYGKNY